MRRRILQQKEPDCSAVILFHYSDCEASWRGFDFEDEDENESKPTSSDAQNAGAGRRTPSRLGAVLFRMRER